MFTKATQSTIALSLVFLAACASTSTPPPAAAPTSGSAEPIGDARFPIVVHRPFAAGQSERVAVEVRQRTETVRGAEQAASSTAVSGDSKVELELSGVIEVMAVDAAGRVSLARLTVDRFFDKASNLEIVKAGSRITAERSDTGVVMLVDGKPPAANVGPMIQLAFPMARPGGLLGDEILSTDVPKAVGESWEVSRNSVVTDFEGEGYSAAQGEIAGTVKLASKQPCGKAECLEVLAQLQLKQVSISAQKDARGAGTGSLEAELKMLLPTDTGLPVYEERAIVRSEQDGSAAAGEGAGSTATKIAIKVERDRRATYELVGP